MAKTANHYRIIDNLSGDYTPTRTRSDWQDLRDGLYMLFSYASPEVEEAIEALVENFRTEHPTHAQEAFLDVTLQVVR